MRGCSLDDFAIRLAGQEESNDSDECKQDDEDADQTQGRAQKRENHESEQEKCDDFFYSFACCGQRLAVVCERNEGA